LISSARIRPPNERRGVLGVVDQHDRAGDVRRHQVGGELDAAVGDPERTGKGLHHARLAEARNAFEQRVLTEDQRDQHPADRVALANDRDTDLTLDLGGDGTECGDRRLPGRILGWRHRHGRLRHRMRSLVNLTSPSPYRTECSFRRTAEDTVLHAR
jgi:hypothetical protein